MGNYRLLIKKSATKEIQRLPVKDRDRVIDRIRQLVVDPRPMGSKKLSGQEKYRVRQGNYRILYEIADEELIVTVVRVGHRREVY